MQRDGSALACWRHDADVVVARYDPVAGWAASEVVASPAASSALASAPNGRALVAWATPSDVYVCGFDGHAWEPSVRIAAVMPGGLILDTFGVLGVAANEAGDAVLLRGHAAVTLDRVQIAHAASGSAVALLIQAAGRETDAPSFFATSRDPAGGGLRFDRHAHRHMVRMPAALGRTLDRRLRPSRPRHRHRVERDRRLPWH